MSQEIEEKMLQVYKEYQEGFDNSSDNFPESAKLDNFGYDDYSDYYCDDEVKKAKKMLKRASKKVEKYSEKLLKSSREFDEAEKLVNHINHGNNNSKDEEINLG